MMFLLANWKLVVAGVVLVVFGLFFWHYRATLKENTLLRASINAANAEIEALDAKAKNDAQIRRESQVIIREVRNVPKANDPVSPAIDAGIDAIERMQQRSHATQ